MRLVDVAKPRTRALLQFDREAVAKLDLAAVKADLKALMTDSQDWWPADWGHYGPLFVRQAWHCAGSYRTSDGRGGCDGGRQRFDPERSWDDNTNLNRAKTLLWPIKQKYGAGLSWGDLIILAGDVAISSMGGPVLGFCGGRIDDLDGYESLPLGPSPEQEALMPCPVQGDCKSPLGQNTLGLIYVNPEGPMGKPVPEESAPQIRAVFGRMGMDDAETVALIGGGHAFGKAHGACPSGPGPSPAEQPEAPWPGTCGDGKGNNTFTSGFEGPWTTTPTAWGNQYFQNLLDYNWEVHVGPGGHHQWRPKAKDAQSKAPPPGVMMLTTDVALLHDPDYLELVKTYAANLTALEFKFKHAWYKLVTRDMGPVTRCLGPDVPPPQPFQAPLPPPPPGPAPDYAALARDIARALRRPSPAAEPDTVGGKPYYGALFATLAWQCASSYRETDYAGGCNGARIRFAPQKDWPENAYMDSVLAVLEPLKAAHAGTTLSTADLIVLAGTVALQQALAEAEAEQQQAPGCNRGGGKGLLQLQGSTCTASGVRLRFCGGRVDAPEGEHAAQVQPPRVLANKILQVRDNARVMGLSMREAVALAARPRSPSQQRRLGYSGSWTHTPSHLSNQYFKVLLDETWLRTNSSEGLEEFAAAGGTGLFMTPTDLAIKWDAEMLAIAQEFATDNKAFLQTFASAWSGLMNADRFDGPDGNVCEDDAGSGGTLAAAAASATEAGVKAAEAGAVVKLVLEASYAVAAKVEEEFVEL
ncbi:hypothetical protein HYH02_006298 [Chlamydomonas schloesseri]|uniref:Plant heme peroxidase family profile domain-containing protein n=1 Tax=Chlamydomonas schloesseri TaxID=2026947 RepID=A0A835WJ64_9CHLO|nr:hypothetical protein HYH02_006298 [Chlamydomonas schloesseri]|eukprot:KAG2448406.1 hypothetical protein HYH02_006298 [Chlamydomonas schloesseri]